jgi:hypothetical protein
MCAAESWKRLPFLDWRTGPRPGGPS